MITAAQFLRVVGALVRLNFSTGKDRACVRAHLRRCLYTADLQKRLTHTVTHTVTHTRKRADGSSGNRDVEEYFSSSGNDQKRPENDIFRIFLLFVISRSGVRVRLPAPIFPQRSKVNMGEFPSGQRGQTVNLLSVTSVVRIHLPPPKIPNILLDGRNFLILGEGGFERRLLATCRWHVATAVAFSAEKANPPSCWGLLVSAENRLDPHRDPHGEMSKERRRG